MADVTYATRLNKDDSLKDVLRQHRMDGAQAWKPLWDKASKMQKFANGEHWPEGEMRRAEEVARSGGGRKPAMLTIDEISPVLQTFAGRQMMQRFERAYMPRHPAAAREGEIMTAVDRAMMHAADAEQVESAAFKDGPGIQGVSAIRWELDSLNERGGGLLLSDLPIWQVMADPEARRVNLSDRSWHRYGCWWPQSEVRARWPDKWTQVVNTAGPGRSWSESSETGESSRIPWAGQAGNKPYEPYYPKGKTLWIEYEEWKEVGEYFEVGHPADPAQKYADALAAAMVAVEGQADPLTTTTFKTRAEVTEFKNRHEATFKEEVPKDLIVRKREPVFKFAYLCGDEILETGEIPTGYWTIQFMTGFRFPLANKVTWRSLVERLVDPQRWVNVMISAIVRNVQISPKGLLFVEEGFFKNRNEAMGAWASPGGLIVTGRGKLSTGQPGYKWESGGSGGAYQGQLEALMGFWRDAIPRLAGFNPGALGQLGSDLRRISGEVVRQVQDAAMTANAEPFDSLRLHRREGGRIFLSFLRRFFEVEDIVRIVGEEVAYEPVMEPAMEPVIDPATQQPAIGQDGQPVLQPAVDPMTGQQLTKPAIGPDGQPVRRLVIPPKGSWKPDAWKEITVEDVVPSGDQLQVVWKALETSVQILLQPRPDTGVPLLSSEVLAEIIPGLPAQIREKMRQEIKAAKLRAQQQARLAPQQPQPQAGNDQAAVQAA